MPLSPARAAAYDILLRVDQQNAYASELLHSERLNKLGVADRSLATELVMGVLRWRSRLDEAIMLAAGRPLTKLDVEVLNALRMGVYQLQFLDRVPARAAINESVELVKRAKKHSAAPFANAVLRKIVSSSASLPEDLSVADKFAHPPWLVERWIRQFGEDNARAICAFDQRIPATTIRVDAPEVEQELQGAGIQLAPGTLLASARVVVAGDVTATQAFRDGRVFIQDEASQLVAALVGKGRRLLDCCAAPGGKTAALAARNPAAEIIAAELHPHRVELLRKRVRAVNVQVIQADALQLPFSEGFDRVLADVPCSGTGTLARNPEIKWRLKASDLTDLHAKQAGILTAALEHLAPGGRAVYSTCSLEREENEAVVEDVLGSSPEFRLRDCREELESLRESGELVLSDVGSLLSGKYLRTMPGVHPCDGFFTAIIERL
ncbi:MAG: 16S rRNA (cytosine(967)-C(5))-methyltransferase RsmB [Acidobacteriota bacterium]|nr:16S rRNA (cytosine(967)-C(5))-methyltransferase RsmB [Acidobacteriota bacterium]